MTVLLDTHFHLDFVTDPARIVASLSDAKVAVVAQTLLPSAFLAQVGETPARYALGFHPWWITDERQVEGELAVFAEALPRTRFIGEIGLDLGPRRAANAPLQRRVLDGILSRLGEHHVMSIHAVRAATDVLDALDASGTQATPVFHWFSGTSDELTRLVRRGGYVSINPRMLESKRGRAFVRQVPAERLLLETDLPEGPGSAPDPEAVTAALHATLDKISQLRGRDMRPVIAQTQAQLYGA